MKKPTSRMFIVMEMLQSRGRITGSELAALLNVDKRTIRRYISTLEELGFPITSDRGQDGAYGLRAGYRLPAQMFSTAEAIAISIGLVASKNFGLNGTESVVTGAQAKLERAIPDQIKAFVRSANESIRLDLPRIASTTDCKLLWMFADASRRLHCLRLNYRSRSDSETERIVNPYGLALAYGYWYVAAYCQLRSAVRLFRLDRVISIAPFPASFSKPPEFDALELVNERLATLPRKFVARVELHTSADNAKQELPSTIGSIEDRSANDRQCAVLVSHVDDLDWFARELSRLPFAFTIVSPSELLEALARHVGRLSKCGQPHKKLR